MENVFDYLCSNSGITSIQFSYDGEMFAVTSQDGQLFIFRKKSFELINKYQNLPTPLNQLCWSFDSTEIFVSDGTGVILSVCLSNQTVTQIYISQPIAITCISACRSKPGLVAGNRNGQIIFPKLELDSEIVQRYHEISAHSMMITDICFHDVGMHVISGSLDGTLRLWNVDDGKCESIGNIGLYIINSMCLSMHHDTIFVSLTHNEMEPNNAYLDEKGKILHLQLPDFTKIRSHTGFSTGRKLMKCAITNNENDGNYIVSPCIEGNLIVWKDAPDGRVPEYVLHDHGGPFVAIATSPRKSCVVTGGGRDDGRIRAWKIKKDRFDFDMNIFDFSMSSFD